MRAAVYWSTDRGWRRSPTRGLYPLANHLDLTQRCACNRHVTIERDDVRRPASHLHEDEDIALPIHQIDIAEGRSARCARPFRNISSYPCAISVRWRPGASERPSRQQRTATFGTLPLMEWVILLLLVPAIVVPIVLLFGFAGCTAYVHVGGAQRPTITSAIPLYPKTVELIWSDMNMVAVSFEVERQKGNESPLSPFPAMSPFVDDPSTASALGIPAIEEGTKYSYRVRSINVSEGGTSSWSDPATVETWARAFTAPLEQGGENAAVPGDCIVQRLSPGSLSRPGNLIGITVRGATNADLVLSRVTISSPALSGQPFDSDAAPRDVTTSPLTLTPGVAAPLASVEFEVDIDEALLIAFDVGNPGNARLARAVPHTMYIKQAPPGGQITEAGTQNRAGFVEQPNELWFVDAIDVATKWLPIA
jgi:hypothetical protein